MREPGGEALKLMNNVSGSAILKTLHGPFSKNLGIDKNCSKNATYYQKLEG